MDIGRTLIIGLVAATVVAVLSTLGTRAQPDMRGWRQLKPGPMHWTAIGLGSALIALFAYIRLFVGSTRTDAAAQMDILTGLIIAFAAMTIVTALSARAIGRLAVRWRGVAIIFNGKSGSEQRGIGEIRDLRSNWLGLAVMTFFDGEQLRLDPYATGARELLDRIEQSLSDPREA